MLTQPNLESLLVMSNSFELKIKMFKQALTFESTTKRGVSISLVYRVPHHDPPPTLKFWTTQNGFKSLWQIHVVKVIWSIYGGFLEINQIAPYFNWYKIYNRLSDNSKTKALGAIILRCYPYKIFRVVIIFWTFF